MEATFKDEVIYITGSSGGIGFATAKLCLQKGATVVITGRNSKDLKKAEAELLQISSLVIAHNLDVSNESEILESLDAVYKSCGKIDGLVNNAPSIHTGKIIDMDASYFKESWETCCFGGFLFSREVIKSFLNEKTHGTLIFTGASASLRGKANFGAFNSAKGALRNLAQAIAKEYADQSIHVGHVIIDGGLAGDKIKNRLSDFDQRVHDGKLMNIESVTDAYMFLYNQNQNAWSFELDIRTSKENW